ncbi:MAG: oligoendopeptidase F, partial [Chloroflexota bacterium]
MPAAALPARSEIATELTWDLESIYPTVEAWEDDFRKLTGRLPELEACQGTLGQAAGRLLACLTLRDELEVLLGRLFSYAHMKHDEDNTRAAYQALHDRIMGLYARYAATASFITPEIVAIAPETLASFKAAEAGLAVYDHLLDTIERQRSHVRSAEIEGLLAQSMEIGAGASNIYDMLHDADMTFPIVRDERGEEVRLTHGRYIPMQESPDRRVRKESFEALYATYASYRNTLAASYATSVKGDVFYARAHGYTSAQEAALYGDNVPTEVYSNLLDTVEGRLDLMHRYLRVRKRIMGLDALHLYDVYAPLVPEAKKVIPYEQARESVLAAVGALGSDYRAVVAQGMASRWIDVYETPGKSSGAYSGGSYGTNPFILMNYQDTLDGAYTLAHEMGHSMHSYYTRETQPPVYAEYSLFVAEVASITNEALLTHHFLNQDIDRATRASLVNNELEKYRGTLFRQTMFAHFEQETHRMVEAGEALTSEALNMLYLDLVQRYFGPEVAIDEAIAFEWSRIPHFYRAFYVYQYATGISAATALSQQIIHEGPAAVARYRRFLASGGSDYP